MGGDERQYGSLDRDDIIYRSPGNRRTRRGGRTSCGPTSQSLARRVVLLVGAIGTVVRHPWASVVEIY